MAERNPEIPKSAIARSLGIARSSLYTTPRQGEKDKALLNDIVAVLREHPHYGYRRVALVLGRGNTSVSRIMRKYLLRAKHRKKRFRKVQIPPSEIPNRTKRLSPALPNVFWAGDFTYLRFHTLTIYLVAVLDVYTREIVGFSLGLHHSSQLVVDALEDAKRKREKLPSLFHSDQGSEYQSQLVKGWLFAHHILPSHSARGHPWENGYQESFYRSFKQELGVINHLHRIDELYEKVSTAIHYYNTRRIHSKLKMPPQVFFRAWQEEERKRQSVIHNQ